MRIVWRVLVVLVLIAAVVGFGVYGYNIGVTRGLAQNVQVAPVAPAQTPYLPFGLPFPGYGFGFLGCLVPLFLMFLVFGSLRVLFWHGPLGWERMHRRHLDWRADNGKAVPPFFEEWHRRVHAQPPEEEKKA